MSSRGFRAYHEHVTRMRVARRLHASDGAQYQININRPRPTALLASAVPTPTARPRHFQAARQLDIRQRLINLTRALQFNFPWTEEEEKRATRDDLIKYTQLLPYYQYKTMRSCCDTCTICFQQFEDSDTVRVLGCSHGFHVRCIDKWLLTRRNTCANCRTPVAE